MYYIAKHMKLKKYASDLELFTIQFNLKQLINITKQKYTYPYNNYRAERIQNKIIITIQKF